MRSCRNMPYLAVFLLAMFLAACTASSENGSGDWQDPGVIENQAPVAAAFLEKAGYIGNEIAVDGAKSYDTDGEIASYSWELSEKPAGSNAVLTNSDAVNASFTPDLEGVYKLKLMVIDDDGATGSHDCLVNAIHQGLPLVSSGKLPGPRALYLPPLKSPILSNHRACFKAEPLLISGTEAYIDGEYLYQDYIYDDYGSGAMDPAELNELIVLNGATLGALVPRLGSINYPANLSRYGNNAADLVEFRIALEEGKVVYRVTLNALLEPDSSCIVIACDSDLNILTGSPLLPWDPGALFPGTDEAIFIWGTGAKHAKLDGINWTETDLAISTDLAANQMTVEVPRTISDPTGEWRLTVATGLYDGNGGWLRPGMTATETQPGGAGVLDLMPCGIFNLAFRFDEPIVTKNTPPDERQSVVIRDKIPTLYANVIDFDKIRDRVTDKSKIPQTGWQVRIFPTRNDLGEKQILNLEYNLVLANEPFEEPEYYGPLQTYSLYIPSTYNPGNPAGFTLALHSLGQFHRQYNGSTYVQQIGEGRGNIVVSPNGLGCKGFYIGPAELDTFEVWNDVAHHFNLDPDRMAVSGYSMGGFGTYRYGTLYPDLFGKALSIVGTPTGNLEWDPPTTYGKDKTLATMWLENARNVPFMNLNSKADEKVNYSGAEATNLGCTEVGINGFEQYGYRYRFLAFEGLPHIGLYLLDNYPMVEEFLGDAAVDRNPHHVTLAYVPISDDAALDLIHNHAYWVSELELFSMEAAAGDFPKGVADAFSHGFGLGDPASVQEVENVLLPLPYTETRRVWNDAPEIEAQNRLDLILTNLKYLRVEAERAALNPGVKLMLNITSDQSGRLYLAGDFPRGLVVKKGGVQVDYTYTPVGITIDYVPGEAAYELTPP